MIQRAQRRASATQRPCHAVKPAQFSTRRSLKRLRKLRGGGAEPNFQYAIELFPRPGAEVAYLPFLPNSVDTLLTLFLCPPPRKLRRMSICFIALRLP